MYNIDRYIHTIYIYILHFKSSIQIPYEPMKETVEVYHFEPVDPELLRKVSQRSLEDLTINQRVAEMARNHEKIVAQMSACYNFVCSMMIGPRFGNFGTIQ